jgi:penicillin G amidase
VKTVDLDVTSHMHADIAHELSAVLKSLQKDDLMAIATQLKQWNGEHSADLTAPAIYNNLLSQTMRLAMADEISAKAFEAIAATSILKNSYEHFIKNENSPWWDDRNTKAIETRGDIIERATRKTISLLTEIAGSDPQNWKWGKIHTLTHKHAFDAVKPLRLFQCGPLRSKWW